MGNSGSTPLTSTKMYIIDKNIAVINIPKNGTHSMDWAIRKTYNQDPNFVNGHRKASEMAQYLDNRHNIQNPEFIANIREPVERFVSGLNHIWGQNPNVRFNEAIAKSFTEQNNIPLVFSTQSKWLDVEGIKLFLNIREALEYIGFKGESPHLNQSIKRFTISQVKNHSRYDEILERYAEDIERYESRRDKQTANKNLVFG
jgi:hypothetical protein